jgi:hypothetical protein
LRELFDSAANFFIFKHVDRDQGRHAITFQDLNRFARKATLRRLGSAFHKKHYWIVSDRIADKCLNVAHDVPNQ